MNRMLGDVLHRRSLTGLPPQADVVEDDIEIVGHSAADVRLWPLADAHIVATCFRYAMESRRSGFPSDANGN